MNKLRLLIFSLLFTLVCSFSYAKTVEEQEAERFLQSVADTYTPWQRVSLKGKVRIEGVPVALTLKVYMERSRSIIMSLSAPLLGEVGRLEATPDSLLMVNKRGKKYARENLATRLADFGASLSDVQDLLLGRVFVIGSGTLCAGNIPLVEAIAGQQTGTQLVMPRRQDERAAYGFTLMEDGRILRAVAFTPDERYLAEAEYAYSERDTAIELDLKLGKKIYPVSFTLGTPEFQPSPLQPAVISRKWQRVTLSQLIKSF